MEKAAGHILEGKDVKFEGQFHLDIGQTGPNSAKDGNVALATPQAHIVEKHPEFAVIEVTCSCSTKTYIRCEYADVQSIDQKSDQTKIQGESNDAS